MLRKFVVIDSTIAIVVVAVEQSFDLSLYSDEIHAHHGSLELFDVYTARSIRVEEAKKLLDVSQLLLIVAKICPM